MAEHIHQAEHQEHPVKLRASFSQRFPLLEFIIVLIFFGALVLTAWYSTRDLAGQAEMTGFQNMINSLRTTGLTLVRSQLNQHGELPAEQQNPMNWLSSLPANYYGEINEVQLAQLPPGNWAWLVDRELLVYQVKHNSFLNKNSQIPPIIRFKVQYRTADRVDRKSATIQQIKLIALTFHPWLPDNMMEPPK